MPLDCSAEVKDPFSVATELNDVEGSARGLGQHEPDCRLYMCLGAVAKIVDKSKPERGEHTEEEGDLL